MRPFSFARLLLTLALFMSSGAFSRAMAWVDDHYQVIANDSYLVLDGSTAIPAEFFGPGSDALHSRVNFQDWPLGLSFGCYTGQATLLMRHDDPPASDPGDANAFLFFTYWRMRGRDPVIVTYDHGARSELWDVAFLHASGTEGASDGSMAIHRANGEGGTFRGAVSLLAYQLIFTRRSDGAQRQFSAGGLGTEAFQDVLYAADSPWRNKTDPNQLLVDCGDGFMASYDGLPVETIWTGSHGQLGLVPATLFAPVPVLPSTWGRLKAVYR